MARTFSSRFPAKNSSLSPPSHSSISSLHNAITLYVLRTLNKNINHSECNIFIGKTLFPIFILRNDSIFLKQLNEMGPFTSLEMPIHLKLIHTVQQYWQAKVYPLNKQSSDGKQEVKYSDFQLQILSFIAKLPTI